LHQALARLGAAFEVGGHRGILIDRLSVYDIFDKQTDCLFVCR
jgi:hypothetical protein